jgi:hypothetical protein
MKKTVLELVVDLWIGVSLPKQENRYDKCSRRNEGWGFSGDNSCQ